MKRTTSAGAGALIILCLATWALSGPPSMAGAAQDSAVISIKAASPPHVVTHRLTKDAYQLWGDEIEKRTKGKVKFTWFFGESLVKYPQSYDALKSGVVDVCVIPQFLFPHFMPVSDGLNLPFMVEGAAHAADAGWKMYRDMPEFRNDFKEFKFLGVFASDVVNLAMKDKVVSNLDGWKGLRLAVGSGQVAEMAKLLGAAPQPVGYPDVYMALHRGMAEGTLFPNAPLRSFKITEVTSTHLIANFMSQTLVLGMRLETWNSLPPDVQKVFDELNPSAARLCGHTLTNEGLWVIEALKERGDKFVYISAEEKAKFKQAVKPMYDAWIGRLNAKGMNGQAIYEKMVAISAQTAGQPSPEDDWWAQGRIGKKTSQ